MDGISVPITQKAVNMTQGEDLVAIDAASRGDRTAFDRLVCKHGPALRRFVERRVSVGSVEDVYQETLLSAWVHLPAFTGRSSFKTWLFSIGLNKCRDVSRQKETVSGNDQDQAIWDRSFDRTETRLDVRCALEKLDASERELLDLYYCSQLNLREISEIMEKNLNSVKYSFYQAHKRLAELMGDTHYEL